MEVGVGRIGSACGRGEGGGPSQLYWKVACAVFQVGHAAAWSHGDSAEGGIGADSHHAGIGNPKAVSRSRANLSRNRLTRLRGRLVLHSSITRARSRALSRGESSSLRA